MNSLYALRIRSIGTNYFTLNIDFSILGSKSAMSWELMPFTISDLLHRLNREISFSSNEAQLSKIDSNNSEVFVA